MTVFEAKPGTARTSAHRRARRQEAVLGYLFLLPSLLILGAFGFLPLLHALGLSLFDYREAPGPFIGLGNYARALTGEPEFWRALGVTLWYVVGTVPPTLVLGYLLADLLSARLRGMPFYRTLVFLPYVVSPVAAAAVWKWILNPNFGVVNAATAPFGVRPQWLQEETGVLQLLHLPVPDWAAGPSLALVCIMAVSVWHGLGFAVVVLLAGLSALSQDVLDAARIDGARGWTLLRHVKLPLLSPTLFFLFVVFTIRAFQTFTQIYVMSVDFRGGPNGSTRNLPLYIVQSFNENAARLGAGYGSAVAVLLFLMLLTLTLVQFRVLGRKVFYQ